MTLDDRPRWPHGPDAVPLLRGGLALVATVWGGSVLALVSADRTAPLRYGLTAGATAATSVLLAVVLGGYHSERRYADASERFWAAYERRAGARMLAATSFVGTLAIGLAYHAAHHHKPFLLGATIVPGGLSALLVSRAWTNATSPRAVSGRS